MSFAHSEGLEDRVAAFGEPFLYLTTILQERAETWMGSILGVTNRYSHTVIGGTEILTTRPHVVNLEVLPMTENSRDFP